MTPDSSLNNIWSVSKVNKNTNLHMLYNRLTEAWTSEGLFSKNSALCYKKRREGCWCCVMWASRLKITGSTVNDRVSASTAALQRFPRLHPLDKPQTFRTCGLVHHPWQATTPHLCRVTNCLVSTTISACFCFHCRREQIMTWEERVGVEREILRRGSLQWPFDQHFGGSGVRRVWR